MLFATTAASPLPLLRLCLRQCRHHSRPPPPRCHCSESGGALGASRKGGGCRPPPPSSSRLSSSSGGGPPSSSIVVRHRAVVDYRVGGSRGIGFLHENAARSRRRRWFGDSANSNGSNPSNSNPTLLGRFLSPKPMPPRNTPKWYAEMAFLCAVFGITGTSTMFLVRPAVGDVLGLRGTMRDGEWFSFSSQVVLRPLPPFAHLEGFTLSLPPLSRNSLSPCSMPPPPNRDRRDGKRTKIGPWSYRLCSLFIMTPLYPIILVGVGTVVRRFGAVVAVSVREWTGRRGGVGGGGGLMGRVRGRGILK
jgi:hypothetical protein